MTDTNNARDGLTANREAIFDNLRDKIGVWSDRQTYFNAGWDAALAAPQPQGGALDLTDEQIMHAMEAAGIKFQAVYSPRLKADTVMTVGSIDARKIIAGARALAQSAPSAPQQAGDGLTVRRYDWNERGVRSDDDGAWVRYSDVAHLLAAPRQPGEMGVGVEKKD